MTNNILKNKTETEQPENPKSKENLIIINMKKIILTAAAVFVFGLTNAQDVKYGVKLGINNPSISGIRGEVGHVFKLGINLGGFAEFAVSDKLFVQPELLFSTQGANSKATGLTADSQLNLNYLNIPVMVKYYVIDKLSLEAGPQIGFLVSAKENDTDPYTHKSVILDVKNEYKSLDFGFNLGAGYDFSSNISAGLRYNIGMSNIDSQNLPIDAKNRVLSLSASYKF